MDNETWVDLDDFPGYAVSDLGRVINKSTEMLKTPTDNQQGVFSVNLVRDHKQHRRSVALLVANIFVPQHHNERFDTPMHLDGDRRNCAASNLVWRPLWFVRKYHAQMKSPPRAEWRGVVELIETGEVFDDIRACSSKYGLLEKEIIHSAHNQTPVFSDFMCTFRVI